MSAVGWQVVQEEVRRRIRERIWPPGEMIPPEQELADELGTSRVTVNRALRALSDDGLLERRRRTGTRVALHPVLKATLNIPLIRQEIEDLGLECRYELIDKSMRSPPGDILARMGAPKTDRFLALLSLFRGDGRPYMLEQRFVDLETVPQIMQAPLTAVSANEWLLAEVPFTHGEIWITAETLNDELAAFLGTDRHQPLVVINRITWNGTAPITYVQQFFAPGYEMRTRV